jgi:hypothetical protein
MMDEDLHLQPVQSPDIFRSAIVIAAAILIGDLIPLLPFVWLSRTTSLVCQSCSAPSPAVFSGRGLPPPCVPRLALVAS